MIDFLLSVRDVSQGVFSAVVGTSRFLSVPPDQTPLPAHAIRPKVWYEAVRLAAEWKNDKNELRGDILFIVHGYNSSVQDVIDRHRRLRDELPELGYKGAVVSFDWPSDNQVLAYLSDRRKATLTALNLVSDGISVLSAMQIPTCPTNIHVFAHSTGAFVIREAFHGADNAQLANSGWTVSQVVFAAGDVSAGSMSADDRISDSIYRHGVRLANYFSRRDQALDLSNVKRFGVAPRVGRIGLPDDAPEKRSTSIAPTMPIICSAPTLR
jgi:esterase/lipase superfamily enzyme